MMNPLREVMRIYGWMTVVLVIIAVVVIVGRTYLIFFHWDLYCRLALLTSSVTSAPAACIVEAAKEAIQH